jgi:hypothetical protein
MQRAFLARAPVVCAGPARGPDSCGMEASPIFGGLSIGGNPMRRLLALLLVGCPVAVAAQEGAAAPPPISLTETAAALARNGVQRQNPRAILAAAEILRLAERGSPRMVPTSPRQGPEGPWEGPMTSGALFRLASRMPERWSAGLAKAGSGTLQRVVK